MIFCREGRCIGAHVREFLRRGIELGLFGKLQTLRALLL